MPPTINAANQGDNDNAPAGDANDEDLLKYIRRRLDYMWNATKDIRAAGDICMRALSPEGPWDPADRQDRKDNGRPCLHLDQLGQYVNGFMGEVRQNPIGAKVTPQGFGATDKSAGLRGDRIRQIEFDGNATQASLTALENAVERGYGAFGIITEYKAWDSREQRIKYRRFANPDAVLWDPDCKEADWSDMEDAFHLDRYSFQAFKDKFHDAQITNFGSEHIALAPNWISNDWGVQVGEYWRIEKKKREILWTASKRLFLDELPKGTTVKGNMLMLDGNPTPLVDHRKTEQPQLRQYLTNGVEILDRSDQPGTQVPIFPVIGKERYITESSHQVRRVIYSYVTMAIDGQMLFDFYKTNEAEEVGLTPKPKYAGFEGQFDTNTDWKNLNKSSDSFVQFKPVVDAATQQVLPLPRWDSFAPNTIALDTGAEAARRAIQAALGSYGFTKTDDTNVKSGVALKQLDKKGDLASYHLIDSYKLSVQRASRYVNEILDEVESEPGERGLRKEDGTHELAMVGKPSVDKKGEPQHLQYSPTPDAQHGVTISTGPSYSSQREEASQLVDTLVAGQIPGIERILAPMVRLKNVGPIGDDIADRLELPEFKKDQQGKQDPAQLQKLLEQHDAALNDAMKQLDAFQKQLPKIQSDEKIALAKIEADARKQAYGDDVKLAIAEVSAKQKMDAETLSAFMVRMDHTLQLIMQGRDHEHEMGMAAAGAGQAAAEQAGQQQHEQGMQDGQQEHEQGLQASQQDAAQQTQAADQAHQQTMQQTDIAAQPPPTTSS